ncbi:MAG: M2 family metallopeptidase, partial [Gammaproteobacteria bacterium]|nr:M2 family metallopeptidase [Gammaproteobacteria bacterium]
MNTRIVVAALALTVPLSASTQDTPLLSAEDFVRETSEQYEEFRREGAAAAWAYQTYITPDTALLAARAQERGLKFQSSAVENAKRYDGIELAPLTQRAVNAIKWGSTLPAPNDDAKRRELSEIMTRMEGAYGSGKYCPDGPESCRDLEQLSVVMANSRDYYELLEAWRGWRTISPPIRADYRRFVELGNEGAKELGFNDMGELWRSGYDMPVADFGDEVERLWSQVSPLYEQLHCYTADKLRQAYGEEIVPAGEPIPAHLLGNMWS